MFQKIAKHRANDASNDVHRTPLGGLPEDQGPAVRFCKLGSIRPPAEDRVADGRKQTGAWLCAHSI